MFKKNLDFSLYDVQRNLDYYIKGQAPSSHEGVLGVNPEGVLGVNPEHFLKILYANLSVVMDFCCKHFFSIKANFLVLSILFPM